jgi:hypothetical protein
MKLCTDILKKQKLLFFFFSKIEDRDGEESMLKRCRRGKCGGSIYVLTNDNGNMRPVKLFQEWEEKE